ncbi:hypothetical protein MJD09_16305, partial [bacterium]|nr:hypothetical protein [bacterium]
AKLFATLPDYCPTPDAFAIAPDGTLTLSCPNFADTSKNGVLLKSHLRVQAILTTLLLNGTTDFP